MMNRRFRVGPVLMVLAFVFAAWSLASAADFYKGKTVAHRRLLFPGRRLRHLRAPTSPGTFTDIFRAVRG